MTLLIAMIKINTGTCKRNTARKADFSEINEPLTKISKNIIMIIKAISTIV